MDKDILNEKIMEEIKKDKAYAKLIEHEKKYNSFFGDASSFEDIKNRATRKVCCENNICIECFQKMEEELNYTYCSNLNCSRYFLMVIN